MRIHDYRLIRVKYVSICHIDWKYLLEFDPIFRAYEYSQNFKQRATSVGTCEIVPRTRTYNFQMKVLWPTYWFDLHDFLNVLEHPNWSMYPRDIVFLNADKRIIKRFRNL